MWLPNSWTAKRQINNEGKQILGHGWRTAISFHSFSRVANVMLFVGVGQI